MEPKTFTQRFLVPTRVDAAGQQPQVMCCNELEHKERQMWHKGGGKHRNTTAAVLTATSLFNPQCLNAIGKAVICFEASLPGLADLIICFIIRDMLSRRSSLVFGRHHPSRSVHSDSVPSFRWIIFCRLKSSKREGDVSLLHSGVGFK